MAIKIYQLNGGQWAYEKTTGPFTGAKVFPFPTEEAARQHAERAAQTTPVMPTATELLILRATLTSHHPKAHTKPRNFIRTYGDPENLAVYDAMVEKGWLTKEAIPGHCYRVTSAGKAVFKAQRKASP